MPSSSHLSNSQPLPNVETALLGLTVDELKWYAALLLRLTVTRKAELVQALTKKLTDATDLRQLWDKLSPLQQGVVAEVVHNFGGRYDADVVTARCPGATAPMSFRSHDGSYVFGNRSRDRQATPFDVLFISNNEFGRFIPTDVAATLRSFVPPPQADAMESQDQPPSLPHIERYGDDPPEVFVIDTERAVFHDLMATLRLIDAGKIGVSATTKMPTLSSVRALRQQLLLGDYFGEQGYERAEDAIRPLALVLLVQAVKWASPAANNKLELTRSGQALLTTPLEARHIRDAWQAWLKTTLLDELSRIRNIRGQQAKGTRLTSVSQRRAKLAEGLQACTVNRWITLDEFFRYIRAERLSPTIERGDHTTLSLGSYPEYGWLGYVSNKQYWDIVIGSYLRVVLWEYAATLGIVTIAYTSPEESPHSFGDAYGMDEFEYLSRYDGLLGIRLTPLGAYVLGLAKSYTPPAPLVEEGPPLLKVLPNHDLVITDSSRAMPVDRAFLERIAAPQSEDVYRLSRDLILEATERGLDITQIKQFLATKSGQPESELPQTVRVFFGDIDKRLNALRERGRMVVLESGDPLILTELANTAGLRTLVQLGTIGTTAVLLVPEEQETAARRQLRKLGYVPRKA